MLSKLDTNLPYGIGEVCISNDIDPVTKGLSITANHALYCGTYIKII